MGAKRRLPIGEGKTLLEHFAELPDPRIERTKLHSLSDILVIAVSAVIGGAEGWTDIEEFGKSKEGGYVNYCHWKMVFRPTIRSAGYLSALIRVNLGCVF